MPQAVNIQLSTTGSIVGHELVRHVGPVSAQFVIGTGVFTDVFSSFTDFFGAGSRSYEKKLWKVERQGLDMIRARAAQAGANAVIGLRIDHDEISGAGKSMLMVTLAGTAVIARHMQSEPAETKDGTLSPQILREDLAVRAFVENHGDSVQGFSDAEWDFVLNHARSELAPLVLASVAWSFSPQAVQQTRKNYIAQATAFFTSLPIDEATAFLYARLDARNRHGRAAAEMLSSGELADLSRHLEALNSDEPVRASNAIRSATAHPPLYRPQDSETLRAIAEQLRSGFPVTATRHEKKGFLSNPTWSCGHCGNENSSALQRCEECHRDPRGLDGVSADFEELARTLETRADALDARLKA